jgi:hypothetical protein
MWTTGIDNRYLQYHTEAIKPIRKDGAILQGCDICHILDLIISAVTYVL